MDSIGRTDLPGGSLPTLMAAIFQKLIPLGDTTGDWREVNVRTLWAVWELDALEVGR